MPDSRVRLRTTAMLLSVVAGSVDAIGFLLLFRMFVAHMSGNSAALGAYLGQGEWALAFNHLFPIPFFIAGICAGTVLNEILAGSRARSPFACIAGLEAMLLGLFMFFGSGVYADGVLRTDSDLTFYALATLLLLAMGLQNATAQRVSHAEVQTTYVTGTLNTFARESVRYFQQLRVQRRRRPSERMLALLRESKNHPSFEGMTLSGGKWLLYVAGAVLGSLAKHLWGPGALVLPILVLVSVGLFDIRRPIELKTE